MSQRAVPAVNNACHFRPVFEKFRGVFAVVSETATTAAQCKNRCPFRDKDPVNTIVQGECRRMWKTINSGLMNLADCQIDMPLLNKPNV